MIAQIDRIDVLYHKKYKKIQNDQIGCYGNMENNKNGHIFKKFVAMVFYSIPGV